MRTIDFRDWLATAEAERTRVQAVEAGFAEPYRRERLRDAEEAKFLRRKGTPDSLIGPLSADTGLGAGSRQEKPSKARETARNPRKRNRKR